LAIALLPAIAQPSSAQLFGDRSVGQTLTPQPQPGSTSLTNPASMIGQIGRSAASSLGPNPRFLRSSRDPNAFIGRDPNLNDFIGATQAVGGQVGSSLGDLLPNRDLNVNRPRFEAAPNRNGLYRPRLVLHEELRIPAQPPQGGAAVQPVAERALARSLARKELSDRVQARVVNRTAILEGVVASEHDRLLAAELARLEPGIAAVDNRLRLAAPLPEPDAGPSLGPGSELPSPGSADQSPRRSAPREL
jgi:hypothetical protein